MLKKISKKIAKVISENLGESQEKTEVYTFGLQILLGEIFKLTIILFLAYLLNIFTTTFLTLAAFIIFRKFGGGVHSKTYYRCLSIGVCIFLVIGTISNYITNLIIIKILMFLILIQGIFITIKWVPAGTDKRTIIDKNHRKKLKFVNFIVLGIWFLSMFILLSNGYTSYTCALMLGAAASFTLITPWGYKAIFALDNITF